MDILPNPISTPQPAAGSGCLILKMQKRVLNQKRIRNTLYVKDFTKGVILRRMIPEIPGFYAIVIYGR
jgi:hypothetical protein